MLTFMLRQVVLVHFTKESLHVIDIKALVKEAST